MLRTLPDNPRRDPIAEPLQPSCTPPGALVGTSDEVSTLMEDPASTAVAQTATVVIVGADPCARRLNAGTLRRAGYSVIDLATREQLLDLLAGGAAVDCLVVSEGFESTNARRLVAEARSLCRELRTIIWELDRSSGIGQVCEAVEQLLVDAAPSGDSARRTATCVPGGADRRRRVDS
jgi:hypothetical protein